MDNEVATYGLIGHPLGHSFSARFFADKFARDGIAARYELFDMTDVGELRSFIDGRPDLRGLNVTIPHKEAVVHVLDGLSPLAREIGAVNVITIERDADGRLLRLEGHNSDAAGFMGSLRPLLRSGHRAALVLGTGGASRAVVHVLRKCLNLDVHTVSRTSGKGNLTYADLSPTLVAAHKLIVNATPLGTFPNVDTCPPIPYDALTPEHLLFDLVYNPEETLFLRLGREHGAATMNGLEMLRLQALEAWRIWNGGR